MAQNRVSQFFKKRHLVARLFSDRNTKLDAICHINFFQKRHLVVKVGIHLDITSTTMQLCFNHFSIPALLKVAQGQPIKAAIFS